MTELPRTGVVLAAGEGSRLRPVTEHTPKALVPFFGAPLLDHAVAHLVAAGVERVAVNAFHLGPLVAARVRGPLSERWPRVAFEVSEEPILLGTGGGLDRLRGWIGGERFWVVNADAVFDADLAEVGAAVAASGAAAGWLVTRETAFDRLRTVRVGPGGDVAGVAPQPAPQHAVFCGVHLAGPGLLEHLPHHRPSCVVRHGYLPWMAAGARVAAVEVRGAFWADTGTPERYVDAHRRALARRRGGSLWITR